jgi:glutaminase
MQIMYSCGMYEFSGEWACTIGVPAKSGASGAVFLSVPNVVGLCVYPFLSSFSEFFISLIKFTYSPRLAAHGNSARAVELCSKLAKRFGWNIFDICINTQPVRKPTMQSFKSAANMVINFRKSSVSTSALTTPMRKDSI